MAKVSISEYAYIGRDTAGSTIAAALEPAHRVHSLNLPATGPKRTEEFHPDTRYVRVVPDVNIYYAFGPDPLASPLHAILYAGQTEYFSVRPAAKFSAMLKSD